MPINIGTYHIQPTGIHGLCFGSCFLGPLPLRSLIPEIDHTYLSIEAQCVSHHYPRWTATLAVILPKPFHTISSTEEKNEL